MRRRRRPMPVLPRLQTPKRVAKPTILLACPRVSPEWELSALNALIRPQEKGKIAHRSGRQVVRRDLRKVVESIWTSLGEQFDSIPELHFPTAGDFVFIATFESGDEPIARAAAVAISARLTGTWLAAGTLFVRGGLFFRRERRFKLTLVRARDITLSRENRTRIRRLERRKISEPKIEKCLIVDS